MRKIIEKCIGEKIETLSGVRIDKKEKELFHKFEVYNLMRKALEKNGENIDDFAIEDLDILGEILTLNTEKNAIVKAIHEKVVCTDRVIDILVDVRRKNGSMFSKWQSFSLKLMRELIPAMYDEPKNQMQLLTDMGVFRSKGLRFENCDSIPADLILEEIYNPVVKRSVRITVEIVNALLKKYQSFD